jgi:hypothetical protein
MHVQSSTAYNMMRMFVLFKAQVSTQMANIFSELDRTYTWGLIAGILVVVEAYGLQGTQEVLFEFEANWRCKSVGEVVVGLRSVYGVAMWLVRCLFEKEI